jgi:hypothetical protein
MKPDHLEVNCRKLLTLFPESFQNAAENGFICPELWLAAQSIRTQLLTDVQRNESHNSSIKAICKRNRNLNLPLLSSRVSVRAQLGISSKESKKVKFSAIRASAGQLLEELRDHVVEARKILSDGERWTTPGPAEIPEEKTLNACLSLADPEEGVGTEAWKWGSLRTAVIGRSIRELTPTVCFSMGPGQLGLDSELFFATDKNYSMRYFTKWRLIDPVGPETSRCRAGVVTPFEHVSSADLMMELHRKHFDDSGPAGEPGAIVPAAVEFRRHRVVNMRQLMHHGGRFVGDVVLKPEHVISITKETPKAVRRAAARSRKTGKDIWTALEECFGPEVPRGPAAAAGAAAPAGSGAGGPGAAASADPGGPGAEAADADSGEDSESESIAADDPILTALIENIFEQAAGRVEESEELFGKMHADDAADVGEDLFNEMELQKVASALKEKDRRMPKVVGKADSAGKADPAGQDGDDVAHDDAADIPADDRDELLAEIAFGEGGVSGADKLAVAAGAALFETVDEVDERLFDQWLANADRALGAVRAASTKTKRAGHRASDRSPPELSLVSAPLKVAGQGADEVRQIFYMAWRDASKRDGRKCEIGKGAQLGVIKYSVTLNSAKLWDEHQLYILHPAIGACMEKTTFQRPSVPLDVQHLEKVAYRALTCSQDGVSPHFGWGQHAMKDWAAYILAVAKIDWALPQLLASLVLSARNHRSAHRSLSVLYETAWSTPARLSF